MISCPECGNAYISDQHSCPLCGYAPTKLNNFCLWSPELAELGNAYRLEFFGTLATLENANFWFRSRNRIIIWALRKYFSKFNSFFEIGCGTGFVISEVSNFFPQARISGSEISIEGLNFASQRLPRASFMQMDARRIPFINEFDVVGAFDVLEHIEEDELVLKKIHDALTPHGAVVITVPQHPWLWSQSDVEWSHVRRYTTEEIERKVMNAGFEILRSTSFVSLLLPLMLISRLLANGSKSHDPFDELRLNPLINWMLEWTLTLERWLIQLGISFPAGGSRLLVARKVA